MLERREVSGLLDAAREGDSAAMEELVPIVYQELRRLAQHYMERERPGHTLQATALVHEAFLRLTGGSAKDWRDRAHFFASAACVMRNLLVDHARARRAFKRDHAREVSLEEAAAFAGDGNETLVAVHEALERLAEVDARQVRIVELRYFVGLSIEETAEVLEISDRTVRREWQMAKAWLNAELRGAPHDA